MSRRLRPCLTCKPNPKPGKFDRPRGFTRHDDQICASCRRYGPPDPFPNRFLLRDA